MDTVDAAAVAAIVERPHAGYRLVAWDGIVPDELAESDHLHTVAAIYEADGSVAGFTELVVKGDGAGDAQHYGTGVLPEHCGHGLGFG